MSTGKLLLIILTCGAIFVACTIFVAATCAVMYVQSSASAPVAPSNPMQIAGDGSPGVMVHKSEENRLLMLLAEQHATSMSRRQSQDHDDFTKRSDKVWKELAMSASEICAESWPQQVNDSPESLWTEAFRCWRQSAGHWGVASKRHLAFGYAMSRGDNGVWYFCIIVGN